MEPDRPPNWNFFGTVERLIKATESLMDQRAGHGGVDYDLARNMITRLTVIMDDAGIYTTMEDKDRRDELEARLKSIRERFDVVDAGAAPARAERLVVRGTRAQFTRIPV